MKIRFPIHVLIFIAVSLFVVAIGGGIVLYGKFSIKSTSAAALDYYVDGANGNDSNAGTQTAPWKTIAHAAATVQAGSTVNIAGGQYSEPQIIVANSGTSTGWITFQPISGQQVVIDGSNTDLSNVQGYFKVIGKSYIKISGLTIQNTKGYQTTDGAGIYVTGSNNIVISNNHTINTRSSGIYVKSSSDITADGNNVEKAAAGGGSPEAPNVTCDAQHSVQEDVSFSIVSHFEIKNNFVHDGWGYKCGGEGIDVKEGSSYGSIHNNRIQNLPTEAGYYVDAYDAVAPNNLHDIEIYNNVVSGVLEGITIGAEQGGLLDKVNVYNNISYGNAEEGFNISDCCSTNEGPKTNVQVFNNTFFNNGSNGYGGGIIVRSSKIQNVVFKNNIASQNNAWQIRDKSAGLTVFQNNIIDGYRNYSTEEIKPDGIVNFAGSPMFANATTFDFHLQAGSPAIDKGQNVYTDINLNGVPTLLNFDYENKPRISGAAFDIGAYEYQFVTSAGYCGDGSVQAPNGNNVNEVCDDGNTYNNDQCSSDCLHICTAPQTWNGTSCVSPITLAITNVLVSNLTATSATITWSTNIGANTQVIYGLSSTNLNLSSPLDSTAVTSHRVALSGLSKKTKYYFQVISTDGNGNTVKSGINSFTTKVK